MTQQFNELGRGRPASIRHTDRPSLSMAEWAAQQPASAWKQIKLR